MVVDDEEKANILNTFFSTVFTVENEMLGEIPRNNENPILRVTNLTQEEVRNRLNKIKIDKSPGPDGIHPRVLRELSNVIDKPLFLIFRDSIATGSVPQDWRIANVVPIFKKGSKSEPGNYRPRTHVYLYQCSLSSIFPSLGIFQCGPCSLTALKKGLVYLPYDAKFVFAEVNADRIEWMVKDMYGDVQLSVLKEEKKSIGKFISTKAVNKNLREDITLEYKHKEGSSEERETFKNACSYLKSDASLVFAAPPAAPPRGIRIQITGEKELPPGNPLSLNILIENESDQSKTVTVTAGCQLQAYTGKSVASLASIVQTVEVAGKQALIFLFCFFCCIANAVATIPINVAADQYMKWLTTVDDELMIRLNVITETKEGHEKNSECLVIPFLYPPIKVEMPDTGKINEDFTCTFTFKNTLSIPLEKCELHVEGLGIFKLEKFDQGDVGPGRIFRCKIICAPKKAGEKKIVAELISKQIKGIHAEKIINITN
ncbi:unnamed protein product [Ranitomeya imitator]|uniref:Transglutaminase C-terminal domain-containing protein n=1 Tax=Ranitomeya imitator TaxID=111125 RepID=A0ABN9MJR4_9NEOB|nr:unnamed protein product [Ranitomeya imitator]